MEQVQTNSLLHQLRYWSIHCGVTALPSFCLALMRFDNVTAIIAMLCGITTFILTFTLITSASFYGKLHQGLIGRSIRLGARIRMIISLVSLLPLAALLDTTHNPPTAIMFVPDFWFGLAAVLLFSSGVNALGFTPLNDIESETGFFPIYSITVIEGVLISVSLILIAFIALVILNFKRNRRQLPSDIIPR